MNEKIEAAIKVLEAVTAQDIYDATEEQQHSLRMLTDWAAGMVLAVRKAKEDPAYKEQMGFL